MILLWDIDGTLLDTGGSGVQPLVDAIKKHTGLEIAFHRENVSGLTDYEIVQKLIVEKSKMKGIVIVDHYAEDINEISTNRIWIENGKLFHRKVAEDAE